jgi:hypothetical protein
LPKWGDGTKDIALERKTFYLLNEINECGWAALHEAILINDVSML